MSKPPKKAQKPRTDQSERFKQFALEHGATEDVLDKALGDVASDAKERAKASKEKS